MEISMNINDSEVTGDVEPRVLLVHYLREQLGMTGTHWGCDTTNCGACVVLMDGEPVKSCTVLAAMADGHAIRTVEGLETAGRLDPVQQGFMAEHGLQCGFCTPGMMLTARALLDKNPDPDDGEIREAISGQICRCTGYTTIVRSIRWAAEHPDPAGFGAVDGADTGFVGDFGNDVDVRDIPETAAKVTSTGGAGAAASAGAAQEGSAS